MNQIDLRKAAILVSVLDTASADALLEQLGSQADRVRKAVMELDHVTNEEQAKVIQEFLGRGPEQTTAGDEVTWELPEPESIKAPEPQSTQPAAPASHFAFLSETDPLPLSEQLQKENPQLAAVVLAHLPADNAAQVLQHLPTTMATDVLLRIAHLDETSPEVLADIEAQLRSAMQPHLRARKSREHGAAKVGAILQSLPDTSRGMLQQAIALRDKHLLQSETVPSPAPAKPQLRIAAGTNHKPARPAVAAQSPASKRSAEKSRPNLRIYPPADAAPPFSELGSLSDADWQKLLEAADPELILLAFAGAEPRLIDRLLRGFQKKEADYWRKQFAHPGPVTIREIDAAQEQVAQLAAELADEGILRWPARRGFAALA